MPIVLLAAADCLCTGGSCLCHRCHRLRRQSVSEWVTSLYRISASFANISLAQWVAQTYAHFTCRQGEASFCFVLADPAILDLGWLDDTLSRIHPHGLRLLRTTRRNAATWSIPIPTDFHTPRAIPRWRIGDRIISVLDWMLTFHTLFSSPFLRPIYSTPQ